MRALVLKEFGRLAVEEMSDPEAGPGEVLIRIVATGICGSDIHGYTGENGRRVPGQVMGHESVGRVVAIGEGVDAAISVDDVVTFNPVVIPDAHVDLYAGREQMSPEKYVIGVRQDLVSSFAQLIAVPARNVVALPSDIPIGYGALVEPLAVAVHAVRRATVRPEHRVFVVGGGPIGQSVVLALLMAGVEQIVVSEMDAARRELIERLGARAIDPTTGAVPELVHDALGAQADVTIDAVGISRTVDDALASTVIGGVVCLVGMGAPRVEIGAYRISTEERSVVGSFTYSATDFRDAAEWIATAPAAAAQLISREVPLDEADAAFAGLARGDGTPGKVLVRLDL